MQTFKKGDYIKVIIGNNRNLLSKKKIYKVTEEKIQRSSGFNCIFCGDKELITICYKTGFTNRQIIQICTCRVQKYIGTENKNFVCYNCEDKLMCEIVGTKGTLKIS